MIVDLVMYFLRQGVYNNQGDIAVLCAYLGQLQKVRNALKSLKVTVAVDERDEDQLVKQGLQGDDETSFIEEVAVAKHVCWRWRTISASSNRGCGPQGPARYCRHLPRAGGKDCHRFTREEFGRIRYWQCIDRVFEGNNHAVEPLI